MSLLPESLLRSLERVRQSGQKKLLLIRHADREHIPPGTSGNDVCITSEGKDKAFALGKNLQSLAVNWCKTSPLLRCAQTIDSIAMGYGKTIVHSNSKLLGEPGPFVFDSNRAINAFLDHGTEIVVREMINGNTFPGIRSTREGSELLLRGLITALEENIGDGICISHDSILMPFIAYHCGEQFRGQWLPPLGGVILAEEDNRYTLWWDGKNHRVLL